VLVFEPVHLHGQLANLALQPGPFLLGIRILSRILALEDFWNSLQQFLLPAPDLYWVKLVLRSKLVNRIEPFDRLKRDTGLKLRRVLPSVFS